MNNHYLCRDLFLPETWTSRIILIDDDFTDSTMVNHHHTNPPFSENTLVDGSDTLHHFEVGSWFIPWFTRIFFSYKLLKESLELLPRNLTWFTWKWMGFQVRNHLFKGLLFRFHVKFQGYISFGIRGNHTNPTTSPSSPGTGTLPFLCTRGDTSRKVMGAYVEVHPVVVIPWVNGWLAEVVLHQRKIDLIYKWMFPKIGVPPNHPF